MPDVLARRKLVNTYYEKAHKKLSPPRPMVSVPKLVIFGLAFMPRGYRQLKRKENSYV